jgi:hypothetical protein
VRGNITAMSLMTYRDIPDGCIGLRFLRSGFV